MASAQVAPSVALVPPSFPSSNVKADDHVSTASVATQRDGANGFVAEVVVLTPWVRIALWLLLMAIVAVNTTWLVASAIVYQHHETRNSIMWIFRLLYLSYASNVFIKGAAVGIAVGYAIVAALFALYAFQLLYVSAKRRGLYFGAQPTAVVSTRRVSVERTRSMIAVSMSLWTRFRRLVASAQFLVGVRGPYFDLRLLVDDIFELGSQTAAAYASSRSISNAQLTLAYGIVIFLTSVSPLCFRYIYRASLVKQRMAGLVADLVLDFVWGTLLPLWMAVPVVRIATSSSINEEFDVITSLTRETERVVVLSWKSYALSIIPFIATLLNLIEIQSILREVRPGSQHALTGSTTASNVTVLKLTYSAVPRRHGLLYRGFNCILPLYGIAVLATSIAATHGTSSASTKTDTYECVHRLYPWFERGESCAGRRINCTSAGITGNADELRVAFESFTTRVLSDLLISDCAALTFPPQLQRLSHLQSIVVKNSFVISWGDDASIAAFPRLRAVNLNMVAFATLPTGLVARPLSPYVEYIHLALVANATQLLDAVGSNWKDLRFFDCMGCELTAFHPAIQSMHQLSMFALSFNGIESIPDDWTVAPHMARLDAFWLDMNLGLATLPDSLWRQTATTQIVSLEYTGLTTVPEWLVDVADNGLQIYAANTPLCATPEQIPVRVRPLILCVSAYT